MYIIWRLNNFRFSLESVGGVQNWNDFSICYLTFVYVHISANVRHKFNGQDSWSTYFSHFGNACLSPAVRHLVVNRKKILRGRPVALMGTWIGTFALIGYTYSPIFIHNTFAIRLRSYLDKMVTVWGSQGIIRFIKFVRVRPFFNNSKTS